MKSLLILLFISTLVSCVSTKDQKTDPNLTNNNASHSLNKDISDLTFSTSLSEFIQTMELKKLCNPVKLHVIFSVDTIGKISDPDFRPTQYDQDDCEIDTVYLEKLKVEFEKSMPLWKLTNMSDTTTKARYSIPVTFD
ncbi:MAG: hypothetical protein ABJF04_04675 [Reichenbachiella sp.]|uniref:hypothetical protein n=1 Tax=Reichenbachiella sp. TaxID=2184521 RepID=UPI0032645200